MTFREKSSTNQLLITVTSCKSHPRLTDPFPAARNWTQIHIREAAAFRPNPGVENSNDYVRTVVRFRPETTLVSEAEKLRGASGVKLTATILEDSKHGGVLGDGIDLILGKQSREAMENCVINVKDASWFGKLGGVPVIVGGENRRLGFRINTKDEGLGRARSGKSGSLGD